MGYGRSYGRRGYSRPQTTGRIAKVNARPGPCRSCGVEIPPNRGQLYREPDGSWSVVHVHQEWAGSPVSGQYSGGCPEATERLNLAGQFGRFGDVRCSDPGHAQQVTDTGGCGACGRSVTVREKMPAPEPRKSYAYTSSGARMTSRYGRCEDAPCCGCCD